MTSLHSKRNILVNNGLPKMNHKHFSLTLEPNCTIINFPMCSQNILWMDGKHFYGSSSPAFDARRCNSMRHYSRSSVFSPADCTPDRSHRELPTRRKILTGMPKLPQYPIPWSRRKNCRAKNYSTRWVSTAISRKALSLLRRNLWFITLSVGLVQTKFSFLSELVLIEQRNPHTWTN